MKKFILGFIMGAFLFSIVPIYAVPAIKEAYFNDDISIYLNNNELSVSKITVVEEGQVNGSTYVKLRDIAEPMGGTVTYADAAKRIDISTVEGVYAVPTPEPIPMPDVTALIDAENARHEAALQVIEDEYVAEEDKLFNYAPYVYDNWDKAINLNEDEAIAQINELRKQRDALFAIDRRDYYPIDDQIFALQLLINIKAEWKTMVKERDDKITVENTLHEQNMLSIE